MRNWINNHTGLVKTLLALGNISIFIHFNVAPLQDAIFGVLLLSLPIAFCYGLLTNLFIPSGSRRDYYRSRNDYSE